MFQQSIVRLAHGSYRVSPRFGYDPFHHKRHHRKKKRRRKQEKMPHYLIHRKQLDLGKVHPQNPLLVDSSAAARMVNEVKRNRLELLSGDELVAKDEYENLGSQSKEFLNHEIALEEIRMIGKIQPDGREKDYWKSMKKFDVGNILEGSSLQKRIDYREIGIHFNEEYMNNIRKLAERVEWKENLGYLIRCFVTSDFVVRYSSDSEHLDENQSLYINNQLEVLGHHFLSLFIDSYFEAEFEDIVQADLIKVRHLFMSNRVLDFVATKSFDFTPLLLNPEFDYQGAMALKSFVATSMLKVGFEDTQKFVYKQLLPEIIKSVQEDENENLSVYYIEHVEMLVKHYGHALPVYKRHSHPQDEVRIVGLYVNRKLISEGFGETWEEAKLDCAVNAYNEIMKDKADTLIPAASVKKEDRTVVQLRSSTISIDAPKYLPTENQTKLLQNDKL